MTLPETSRTAVLLDTHTLLWWLFDDASLSPRARQVLADRKHTVWVSAASAWEIATKYRLGRLPDAQPLVEDFAAWMARAGFEVLAVDARHAVRAGLLPAVHRDPFDRMLAAQAALEGMAVLGRDVKLGELGAVLVW